MADYNLYFMNSATGHIDRVADFEAPDHGEAERIAQAQQCQQPMELWCNHRKIQRFEAIPARAQTASQRLVSRWDEKGTA